MPGGMRRCGTSGDAPLPGQRHRERAAGRNRACRSEAGAVLLVWFGLEEKQASPRVLASFGDRAAIGLYAFLAGGGKNGFDSICS